MHGQDSRSGSLSSYVDLEARVPTGSSDGPRTPPGRSPLSGGTSLPFPGAPSPQRFEAMRTDAAAGEAGIEGWHACCVQSVETLRKDGDLRAFDAERAWGWREAARPGAAVGAVP